MNRYSGIREQTEYDTQRKYEDRRRAIEDRFFAIVERQAHPWTWWFRRAYRRWFA